MDAGLSRLSRPGCCAVARPGLRPRTHAEDRTFARCANMCRALRTLPGEGYHRRQVETCKTPARRREIAGFRHLQSQRIGYRMAGPCYPPARIGRARARGPLIARDGPAPLLRPQSAPRSGGRSAEPWPGRDGCHPQSARRNAGCGERPPRPEPRGSCPTGRRRAVPGASRDGGRHTIWREQNRIRATCCRMILAGVWGRLATTSRPLGEAAAPWQTAAPQQP